MKQTAMFDDPDDAKRDGMERADAGASPDWKAAVDSAIVQCARDLPELTSMDVWDRLSIEDRVGVEARALGPAMLRASRAGIIQRTDRVVRSNDVRSHNRPLAVWVSAIRRPS